MDRAPIAFLTENMKVWNQDILDPADDFCGWPSCIISLLLLRLGLSQSKKTWSNLKKTYNRYFQRGFEPHQLIGSNNTTYQKLYQGFVHGGRRGKKSNTRESYFARRRYLVAPPLPSPAPSFLGANWKFPANCAAPILTRRSNWIFRFHFFRAAIKCTFFSNHIYFVSYLLKGRGSEGVRGAWQMMQLCGSTNLWRRVSPKRGRRCWIFQWIRCDSPKSRHSPTSPATVVVPPG